MIRDRDIDIYLHWKTDWNKFCRDVLLTRLDKEQEVIIDAVQNNGMVSVASGTARGKDFVAACAALCFMYLTPEFDDNLNLKANTKIALTAPSGRQIKDIMLPEITRLFNNAKILPGRLVGNDIRTNYDEWFLTGFKSLNNNIEMWSGFHAVNTMFVVTEASGIDERIYEAIEGNLQNNSRLLLVFNPNSNSGYAANSMKNLRFRHFRLNSLNAENVVSKTAVIPGQVNYEWVKDKVENWCLPISEQEYNEGEGDFIFEGCRYRPNDLFRVKVLALFPKVSKDVLIPYEWIELANKRYEELEGKAENYGQLSLGVDIAGMGRDASILCYRYGDVVDKFVSHQSGGVADHMYISGLVANEIGRKGTHAYIDTIGEGAGVYSRLVELGFNNAISCKGSESAHGLTDATGEYSFVNMRAYLHWQVRDWLNPKNNRNAALPKNDLLLQEATEIKWKFQSDGRIMIEPKDDIKARLGRSPDNFDALMNTFYPHTEPIDLSVLRNIGR